MGILSRFSLYLLPALVQGGISFLMVPVTTLILGPADIGAYALVSSLVALGGTLASMGFSFVLSTHYPAADAEARKGLVTALLLLGLAIEGAFCAAFLAAWPHLAARLGLASLPPAAPMLALASLVFGFPWSIACEIAVLEGRSGLFAAVTVAHSLLAAAATAIGLYALDLGLLALFASGAAASLVHLGAGSAALIPHLRVRGAGRWVGAILKVGPTSVMGGLAESLQTVAERSLLSAHAGLLQLGLYSHSQQYRQLAFTGVKAVTRSIWPRTLAESREKTLAYAATGQAWALVHLGLAMAGVFFATLGREAIALLTHNKFTAAYPLATLWILWLLVKHTGRAELGYLVAHGHTGFLAALTLATVCLSIPFLFLLVPRLGLPGAMISLFIQEAAFRAGLTWRARRLRSFPFQDGWAALGGLLMGAVLAGVWKLDWSLGRNASLFAVLEAGLAWILISKIRDLPRVPAFLARKGAAPEGPA